MCKQITENAVFGGHELDLLEEENCINGEDRAHVEATGVGPIKQFRRLLSLMLLRDFRTLLVFLRSLLSNNKHVVERVLAEFDKFVQQHFQKPTQCTLCNIMSRVDISLVLDELLSDDEDWLPFYIKGSQNVSVGPDSKFWRELVNRVISHELHVNVANVISKALSNCGFHSDIVKMLSNNKRLHRNSFICRCNEDDRNRSDFMRPYLRNNEESNQDLEERKSSPITHDGFHVMNNADARKTGFLRHREVVSDNKTLLRMDRTGSENKTRKLFASETKESGILNDSFVIRSNGTHFEKRIARPWVYEQRKSTANRCPRDTSEPRMYSLIDSETVKKSSYGNDDVRDMRCSSNSKECYEDCGNKTTQVKVKTTTQECDQLYLLKTSMQEQDEMRTHENRVCQDKRSTPNDNQPHSYETLGQERAVPRGNLHIDENEIIPTLVRELEKKIETQKKNCWSGKSPNAAGCRNDSCESIPLRMAYLKDYMSDEALLKTTIHKPDKPTETTTTSELSESPNGNQFEEVSSENFENKMTLLKDVTPEELIGDEGIDRSFETQSYGSVDQQTLLSVSTDKQKAEEFRSSGLENEKEASGIGQQMALLKNDIREYDDGTDSGISWCQFQQNTVNDDNSITDDKGTGLKFTKDDSHAPSSSDSELQRISSNATNSTPVLETFADDERHHGDREIVVFDILILVIFAITLFNCVILYSI